MYKGILIGLVIIVLPGCSHHHHSRHGSNYSGGSNIIIDTKGVDMQYYQQDLQE